MVQQKRKNVSGGVQITAIRSLDKWHGCLQFLRKHLKGWSWQKIGEQKRDKRSILQQLEKLDRMASIMGLLGLEWKQRHNLENQLESIYQREEIYWRRRTEKKWIIKGVYKHSFSSVC